MSTHPQDGDIIALFPPVSGGRYFSMKLQEKGLVSRCEPREYKKGKSLIGAKKIDWYRISVACMTSKGKILLMDDEQVILDVTQEVMKFLGYDVMFATEGAFAIELFSREKMGGRPFDLVILDLSVPEGMGGKEAFEKIREVDPSVKVVISSGYTNDPMMTDYATFGLAGILAKPYRITDIKALLEKMIQKKG